MLAIYGPNHGFGWKANEIIGAQIVSAPMQVAYDHAKQTRLLFLEIYFLVLIVLGTLLNVGLGLIVTGPVRRMSHIAEEVSLGRSDAPQFHGRGSDEIARLGQSFTRMRRSLEQALRMLQRQGV
jgi:protein-histidine pros-kinase